MNADKKKKSTSPSRRQCTGCAIRISRRAVEMDPRRIPWSTRIGLLVRNISVHQRYQRFTNSIPSHFASPSFPWIFMVRYLPVPRMSLPPASNPFDPFRTFEVVTVFVLFVFIVPLPCGKKTQEKGKPNFNRRWAKKRKNEGEEEGGLNFPEEDPLRFRRYFQTGSFTPLSVWR